MSNHLAVATVTATLHTMLLNAAAEVPGAKVTTKRPDAAPPAGPGINAYLYQVSPNAAYRNADLPTRNGAGELARKPMAALNLYYLLSFVGDDAQFEPQRLLGAAVRELHAQPTIRPQDITSTIGTAPFSGVLAASNLAKQIDLVRLSPLNLSLDELSKMWSVFFQIPYALSVAYQASAVLIEADDVPRAPLPVRERNVYAVPVRQPTVRRIVSASDEDAPIFANSTLLVEGSHFLSDATRIRIDGTDHEPASMTNTVLTLAVPVDLAAGVHAVQIIQKRAMGEDDPADPQHPGFQSAIASFVLQPRVKKVTKAAGPRLNVTLEPAVQEGQHAALLLSSTSQSVARRFVSEPDPLSADSALIKFKVPGVPPGEYFVAVQIDDVASPLGGDGPSPAPKVTLP